MSGHGWLGVSYAHGDDSPSLQATAVSVQLFTTPSVVSMVWQLSLPCKAVPASTVAPNIYVCVHTYVRTVYSLIHAQEEQVPSCVEGACMPL